MTLYAPVAPTLGGSGTYFRLCRDMDSDNGVRVRVRLSRDALAVAEENTKRRGLSFGEYIRIILTTPAPLHATWADIGVEMERRLKEAERTKRAREAEHGNL